ncbi:MAG: hypothetical protein VB118_12250 [Oscillospiraceae bacterium]|nr:hypothetical protein [Oscillospiraceae bacterium]
MTTETNETAETEITNTTENINIENPSETQSDEEKTDYTAVSEYINDEKDNDKTVKPVLRVEFLSKSNNSDIIYKNIIEIPEICDGNSAAAVKINADIYNKLYEKYKEQIELSKQEEIIKSDLVYNIGYEYSMINEVIAIRIFETVGYAESDSYTKSTYYYYDLNKYSIIDYKGYLDSIGTNTNIIASILNADNTKEAGILFPDGIFVTDIAEEDTDCRISSVLYDIQHIRNLISNYIMYNSKGYEVITSALRSDPENLYDGKITVYTKYELTCESFNDDITTVKLFYNEFGSDFNSEAELQSDHEGQAQLETIAPLKYFLKTTSAGNKDVCISITEKTTVGEKAEIQKNTSVKYYNKLSKSYINGNDPLFMFITFDPSQWDTDALYGLLKKIYSEKVKADPDIKNQSLLVISTFKNYKDEKVTYRSDVNIPFITDDNSAADAINKKICSEVTRFLASTSKKDICDINDVISGASQYYRIYCTTSEDPFTKTISVYLTLNDCENVNSHSIAYYYDCEAGKELGFDEYIKKFGFTSESLKEKIKEYDTCKNTSNDQILFTYSEISQYALRVILSNSEKGEHSVLIPRDFAALEALEKDRAAYVPCVVTEKEYEIKLNNSGTINTFILKYPVLSDSADKPGAVEFNKKLTDYINDFYGEVISVYKKDVPLKTEVSYSFSYNYCVDGNVIIVWIDAHKGLWRTDFIINENRAFYYDRSSDKILSMNEYLSYRSIKPEQMMNAKILSSHYDHLSESEKEYKESEISGFVPFITGDFELFIGAERDENVVSVIPLKILSLEQQKNYLYSLLNKTISGDIVTELFDIAMPTSICPEKYVASGDVCSRFRLPRINLDTAGAKATNKKIIDDFFSMYSEYIKNMKSVYLTSQDQPMWEEAVYDVGYKYSLKGSILKIEIFHKAACFSGEYLSDSSVYYYDMKADKLLSYVPVVTPGDIIHSGRLDQLTGQLVSDYLLTRNHDSLIESVWLDTYVIASSEGAARQISISVPYADIQTLTGDAFNLQIAKWIIDNIVMYASDSEPDDVKDITEYGTNSFNADIAHGLISISVVCPSDISGVNKYKNFYYDIRKNTEIDEKEYFARLGLDKDELVSEIRQYVSSPHAFSASGREFVVSDIITANFISGGALEVYVAGDMGCKTKSIVLPRTTQAENAISELFSEEEPIKDAEYANAFFPIASGDGYTYEKCMLRFPCLNSDMPGAKALNEKLEALFEEKYSAVYADYISGGGDIMHESVVCADYNFALICDTYVIVISETIKSSKGVKTSYTLYYYDSAVDREISLDEFASYLGTTVPKIQEKLTDDPVVAASFKIPDIIGIFPTPGGDLRVYISNEPDKLIVGFFDITSLSALINNKSVSIPEVQVATSFDTNLLSSFLGDMSGFNPLRIRIPYITGGTEGAKSINKAIVADVLGKLSLSGRHEYAELSENTDYFSVNYSYFIKNGCMVISVTILTGYYPYEPEKTVFIYYYDYSAGVRLDEHGAYMLLNKYVPDCKALVDAAVASQSEPGKNTVTAYSVAFNIIYDDVSYPCSFEFPVLTSGSANARAFSENLLKTLFDQNIEYINRWSLDPVCKTNPPSLISVGYDIDETNGIIAITICRNTAIIGSETHFIHKTYYFDLKGDKQIDIKAYCDVMGISLTDVLVKLNRSEYSWFNTDDSGKLKQITSEMVAGIIITSQDDFKAYVKTSNGFTFRMDYPLKMFNNTWYLANLYSMDPDNPFGIVFISKNWSENFISEAYEGNPASGEYGIICVSDSEVLINHSSGFCLYNIISGTVINEYAITKDDIVTSGQYPKGIPEDAEITIRSNAAMITAGKKILVDYIITSISDNIESEYSGRIYIDMSGKFPMPYFETGLLSKTDITINGLDFGINQESFNNILNMMTKDGSKVSFSTQTTSADQSIKKTITAAGITAVINSGVFDGRKETHAEFKLTETGYNLIIPRGIELGDGIVGALSVVGCDYKKISGLLPGASVKIDVADSKNDLASVIRTDKGFTLKYRSIKYNQDGTFETLSITMDFTAKVLTSISFGYDSISGTGSI